jgi:hypothetical protein
MTLDSMRAPRGIFLTQALNLRRMGVSTNLNAAKPTTALSTMPPSEHSTSAGVLNPNRLMGSPQKITLVALSSEHKQDATRRQERGQIIDAFDSLLGYVVHDHHERGDGSQRLDALQAVCTGTP